MERKSGLFIILGLLIFFIIFLNTGVLAEVIVKEYEPGQLFKETDFNDGSGLPWHIYTKDWVTYYYNIKDGKLVYFKEPEYNGDKGDVQFKHRNLYIEKGHTYTLKYSVTASNSCTIYARVGNSDEFNTYDLMEHIYLTAGEKMTIRKTFTAQRSANVEFSFYLGEAPSNTLFEFDNISLVDPEFEGYSPDTIPDYREIRVNQLGYFPARKKTATLHTESLSPVEWWLEDSNGNKVTSGLSEVFGFDKDSGENVHIIDFSHFRDTGKNYMLYADSKPVYDGSNSLVESYPFDISVDIYNNMLFDALKYFYHSRSGEPILERYVQRPDLAREAGHPKDIMKFRLTEEGQSYENLEIDLTGGWYAPGSYGKFISRSVWLLQNILEYNLYIDDNNLDYMNYSLNIPESNNEYPDILDEARVNLEVMLKMQIPEGYDNAGMVSPNGGSNYWLDLATDPLEATALVETGEINRILSPPHTESTLEFAAITAQSYRLWREYDSDFAYKCLIASERAWSAAMNNPIVLPSGTTELYNIDDGFYWAASELYVSTGKDEYMEFIRNSEHYLQVSNYIISAINDNEVTGPFDSDDTVTLGTMALALVPNELPVEDIKKAKLNIVKSADVILSIQDSQGYGIPIKSTYISHNDVEGYPFGSNYYITNSSIILAYSYYFTDNKKYLDGVVETFDYLMGRNPNEKTYITGYGDYPVKNPHHRFFAYQYDNSYPKPPAGFIVGGPNTSMPDSWILSSGLYRYQTDIVPQKLYIDNINSLSTNMTVPEWQASFVWVNAFLVEHGNDGGVVSEIKLGDLNNDREINSIDYTWMRRLLLGNTVDINMNNADINEDGDINSIDYTLLRRILVGNIQEKYSLSGILKDPLNTGIEDVIIHVEMSDNSSKTVSSDSTGYWSVSNLSGEIILLPEKEGYIFEPSSIAINHSEENIDIIGQKSIDES